MPTWPAQLCALGRARQTTARLGAARTPGHPALGHSGVRGQWYHQISLSSPPRGLRGGEGGTPRGGRRGRQRPLREGSRGQWAPCGRTRSHNCSQPPRVTVSPGGRSHKSLHREHSQEPKSVTKTLDYARRCLWDTGCRLPTKERVLLSCGQTEALAHKPAGSQRELAAGEPESRHPCL